jgi:hypothetical protein
MRFSLDYPLLVEVILGTQRAHLLDRRQVADGLALGQAPVVSVHNFSISARAGRVKRAGIRLDAALVRS